MSDLSVADVQCKRCGMVFPVSQSRFHDCSTWQPIETAPKDGRGLLLYCPDGTDVRDMPHEAATICVGWYGNLTNDDYPYPDAWCGPAIYVGLFHGGEYTGSWTEEEVVEIKPTHWMVLPAPPE